MRADLDAMKRKIADAIEQFVAEAVELGKDRDEVRAVCVIEMLLLAAHLHSGRGGGFGTFMLTAADCLDHVQSVPDIPLH
jgi:hypothetical protein